MKPEIHPLTPERWADFEKLFGARGACAGCWCMYWRLPRKAWQTSRGTPNRQAMRRIVETETPPGLLAYVAGAPAGWCALSPREIFLRLNKSRVLKPVDEKPVWAVTCFYVAKPYRRRGLTVALLQAAARFARDHGASLLEGYPTDAPGPQPDVFVYTGLASAFKRAGFREVARRSPSRPIFRRKLRSQSNASKR